MTSPDIVVLDTREATDKAGFLRACARDLSFPDYFGGNWDAFEECLGDFADENTPAVVVWTGAAQLPEDVRKTALDIFSAAFIEGVDLVITDDVAVAPPFMSWTERIAVPKGGLERAAEFWSALGMELEGGVYDGPGMTLQLLEVDTFHPGLGPVLAVSDLPELRRRAQAADLKFHEEDSLLSLSDPFGTLISFTPY